VASLSIPAVGAPIGSAYRAAVGSVEYRSAELRSPSWFGGRPREAIPAALRRPLNIISIYGV